MQKNPRSVLLSTKRYTIIDRHFEHIYDAVVMVWMCMMYHVHDDGVDR